MITTVPFDRQLHAGISDPDAACAPSQLLAHIDPLLLARKGLLYLPCPPDVGEDVLLALVASYYDDTSLDVTPSLARALAAAYARDPGLCQRMPLAVVVQGSELYGVGSRHANLWLVHRDEARSLLAPWQDREGATWMVGRWRLMVNDMVLLGNRGLTEKLGAKRLFKIASARRSLEDLARSLARMSAESKSDRPTVMVLRVPGFSPTDALGHQTAATQPSGDAPLRDSSQRSPIWTALLIASILVGASLAISRPEISKESALAMVAWMLTPMPTETPAPTPTPTQPAELPPEYRTAVAQATQLALERAAPLGTRGAQSADTPESTGQTSAGAVQPVSSATPTPEPNRGEYPLPKLVFPAKDQNVRPTYLTLQWEWDGELGEDEYFDVRLWIMGGEKRGIAWTKQPQYIKRASDSGWHSWSVVVIRGRDGVVLEELSDEPTPINFNWSVRGKDANAPTPALPTPAPPTRTAPEGPPTRVPPTGN